MTEQTSLPNSMRPCSAGQAVSLLLHLGLMWLKPPQAACYQQQPCSAGPREGQHAKPVRPRSAGSAVRSAAVSDARGKETFRSSINLSWGGFPVGCDGTTYQGTHGADVGLLMQGLRDTIKRRNEVSVAALSLQTR